MAARAKAATKAAPKNKTTARKKPAAKKSASKKSAAKKAAPKKRSSAAAGKSGTGKRSAASVKTAAGGKSPTPPMMKALRAEHQHMATVMQLFEQQLEAIESGELVDTHVVYEIMDYMVTWPDRFHHPREDLIYARVAEIDSEAADEVDTLQRDHDNTAQRGGEVLQEIRRWREGEVTGNAVVKRGREYIAHIYEHMNVEEKVVFPHIEKVLKLQDWRELAEDDRLQAVADPVFGPRVQREFRNMTRKLRRGLRRSVERGTVVEWIGIEALMESLEVVSIAYDSARDSTGEHLRGAFWESVEFVKRSPLSAPWRLVANNTRVTFRILGDVADISRETLDDLSRVNQERKDRLRLLDRD